MAESEEIVENPVGISCLPTEILTNIFARLDTKSKGRCARVCWNWMTTCYQESLWRDVTFLWCSKYMKNNQTILDNLKIRKTRQVALKMCKEDGSPYLKEVAEGVTEAMPESKITELIISGNSYIGAGSILLASPILIDLVRLDLDLPFVASDWLLMIIPIRFKKLTHLSLACCRRLTTQGFQSVFGHWGGDERNDTYDLPRLEYLKMEDCINMTDFTMNCLSRSQPRLKYLRLTNASNVTNHGLRLMSNLQKLEVLMILGGTSMTTEEIDEFAASANLRVLEIDTPDGMSDDEDESEGQDTDFSYDEDEDDDYDDDDDDEYDDDEGLDLGDLKLSDDDDDDDIEFRYQLG